MRPGLAFMDAALPVTADAAPVMDEDAFRAFYDRTARRLGVSVSRHPATARSPTTCCRRRTTACCARRAVFESEDHRVHYLFRIAANLLADTHRRRPPEHVPLSDGDGREDAGPDTARALEQRTDVARALATLAPRDRDMLWLAYADGASHAEIASHLGVARPSVKAMLFARPAPACRTPARGSTPRSAGGGGDRYEPALLRT